MFILKGSNLSWCPRTHISLNGVAEIEKKEGEILIQMLHICIHMNNIAVTQVVIKFGPLRNIWHSGL